MGEATNNQAEYAALLAGLDRARKHTDTELTCTLDSELVVKQLNGEYKVKSEQLKKLVLPGAQPGTTLQERDVPAYGTGRQQAGRRLGQPGAGLRSRGSRRLGILKVNFQHELNWTKGFSTKHG
ncbi:MAG: reverse transcriptase-like protein [Hymenobacter sp.]